MQAKRDLIEMAMRWLSDDGPLIRWYMTPLCPLRLKKRKEKTSKFWIPLTKRSGSAHVDP